MRRVLTLVAVVVCLLAVAACGDRSGEPSPTGAAQTGTTIYTLESRSYRLYVPPNLPTPAPLVLMLHGGFGSAEHAQEHYGWDEAAREYGLVVAYPDGSGRAWAAGGGCCGRPGRTGVNDVRFLTAVVADVGTRVPVDPARVYATGMSNGGMMSYRLACDATVFAAIAPVAATLLGDCPSPAPISVLHVHGLADNRVRFDGSAGSGFAGIDGPPVGSVVDTWRTVADCAAPETTTAGDVTTVLSLCPQGREVVLVTVAGAGHQWPGSTVSRGQVITDADPPSSTIDATEMIARFFLAH